MNSSVNMRHKFLKIAAGFILLLIIQSGVGSLLAQVSLNAEAQAKLVSEFEINGLKVIFKRRTSSPTIAAGLFIRGGVQNINAKNAGIENLMLSVLTEAGKNFSKAEVRRQFARTGSGIGASSGVDFSVISLGTTRENFDKSWEIFTDLSINPAFAAADLKRVRDQILTGLRDDTDNPENYLAILADKAIHANHPYANDPRGSAETISKFSSADLAGYHKNLMETSKLLLVVVGDVELADLKTKITNSFGKLPSGNYKALALPSVTFSAASLDIFNRELPTNYIQGEFAAPSIKDVDYFAMRVAISILAGRVFEEVRVQRNLSYAPNAEIRQSAANSANISVSAVDANRAVSVMLNEIKRMQTQDVGKTDISGVTGQYLTRFYIGQETNAAQAGELARYELIGGGWRNSLSFLDSVKKVSQKDVREVSNKYMKNIRFFVVGDPAAISKEIFLQK
jgi:zinc protease